MPKPQTHIPTVLIVSGILIFIIILASVFILTAKLGQRASLDDNQKLIESSRENTQENQQIRRIRFISQLNGESMEILMDGTVNYYDKDGNLIKTGRRGFAETQKIFREFEWLLNSGKPIEGGEYQIEIETNRGVIVIDPGGSGGGGDAIDDAIDFIDHTLNPTPTPISSPTPTPNPSASPTVLPSSSPDPSATPDYTTTPPFECSDYYTSGKPIKISNIICGPEP